VAEAAWMHRHTIMDATSSVVAKSAIHINHHWSKLAQVIKMNGAYALSSNPKSAKTNIAQP